MRSKRGAVSPTACSPRSGKPASPRRRRRAAYGAEARGVRQRQERVSKQLPSSAHQARLGRAACATRGRPARRRRKRSSQPSSMTESRPMPSSRDSFEPDATSRLSPHLHFGEIEPEPGLARGAPCARCGARRHARAEAFLRQIGWREFSHHLLHHFPTMATAPLRPDFADFPWRNDEAALAAWQRGQTGYPIVDAAMRQLWQTGWMPNRTRMIVASFLVKHLLIPWQTGAAWFWDTLVDADLANNAAGWQWVAGCGTDAAPYFRVFNPVLQGRKFDAGRRLCARPGCRSLRTFPRPTFMRHGRRRTSSSRKRTLHWAATIRSRSSITPPRGPVRCALSTPSAANGGQTIHVSTPCGHAPPRLLGQSRVVCPQVNKSPCEGGLLTGQVGNERCPSSTRYFSRASSSPSRSPSTLFFRPSPSASPRGSWCSRRCG